MDIQLQERLADALALRGGMMPAVQCAELYALTDELFTPEEAALAVKMPFGPTGLEDVAVAAGMEPEAARRMLEGMADKGLVFINSRAGKDRYNLMALLPGVFEFQFMRGETRERDKKMARLFDNFFKKVGKLTTSASLPRPQVPFSRVIPIDRQVRAGIDVLPYEQIAEYIDQTDDITVSACYCRHHGELLGSPCDKPKEVCFSFGPSAKFVAERGFGRPVSKQEARELMDLAEEAGLVHCSSNTTKYIDFVCNCCECHCGILRAMKDRTSGVVAGAHSNYIIEADTDACIACEVCVERCPMDALSVEDTVIADLERCIGCGVCVSTCPTEALKLTEREERQTPPGTHHELMTAMIESIST